MEKILPLLLSLCVLLGGCEINPEIPSPAAALTPTTANTSTPRPAPTPTEPPSPAVIEPLEISEESKIPPLVISAFYPHIQAAGDPRFDGFNQAAEDLVQNFVNDFRTFIHNADIPYDKVESAPSHLNLAYEILYAQDGLISVVFTAEYYVYFAAHPTETNLALNYDLEKDRPVALEDLFVVNDAFLQALADFINVDIMYWSWGKNILPDLEEFQTWNIQPDGLRITFDPGVVAAHVVGSLHTITPYDLIREFILPGGKLAEVVK